MANYDVESHTQSHKHTITHIPGTEECFVFTFLAPYARTTRYEEAFFPWKTKEKKARFARVPHENNNVTE